MTLKNTIALTGTMLTMFLASEAFGQTQDKKPANHNIPSRYQKLYHFKQNAHSDSTKIDTSYHHAPYVPPLRSILPHSWVYDEPMMAAQEQPQVTKKPEGWNFS